MAPLLVPPSPDYAASCIAAMREGFARGIQLPAPEARIREIEADFARYVAQITAPGGRRAVTSATASGRAGAGRATAS